MLVGRSLLPGNRAPKTRGRGANEYFRGDRLRTAYFEKEIENFQGSQSVLMLLTSNPSLSILCSLFLLCRFVILLFF